MTISTVYQIARQKIERRIPASLRRKILLTYFIVCCLVVGISLCIFFHEISRNFLTVAFLNVGQGDAIFIEAPNGNQVLIDGGPTGSVVRELTSVMPFYDHSLNMIVITHPDSDHIGGLPDIISRYSIEKILQTNVVGSSTLFREVVKRIDEKKIPKQSARRGQRFVIDEKAEIYLDILFPDRNVERLETNTSSMVALLRHKNISVLLTGDSPKGVEKFLAEVDANDIQVDILKLGHHGSNTSSDEIFLTATRPHLAIVSAGKDNRYHHPHKDVIARLEKLNIPHVTTFESRRVYQSDGERIWENIQKEK